MEELKLGRVYKIICKVSNDVYVGSTFRTLSKRWIDHKNMFNRWLEGKTSTITIYPIEEKYGVENFRIELIKEYKVCDRKHLEMYETLWICRLKSCNKNIPFRIRYLIQKQYRQDNKDQLLDYYRKYREENKDQIEEKRKRYYEENRDQILARRKQYNHENKEQRAARSKKYYKDNKAQISMYKKRYEEENKEQLQAKRKRYYEENKEQCAARSKKYQEENKVQILAQKKQYYEQHSERRKQPFTCECGSTITIGTKSQHFRTKKHLAFINQS